MNRNIIAILANELGGYDEAAEALGVSEDLIAYAIEGGELSEDLRLALEGGWADLRRDAQALELYGLNISEIRHLDDELSRVQDAVQDINLIHDLRFAYAENRITRETLESQGLDVFNDLTLYQSQRLIEWLLDEDNAHTAQGFADAYLATRDRVGGIFSVDRNGSEFWEWMREHGLDDSA